MSKPTSKRLLLKDAWWFLRPTLAVLLCFLLAGFVAYSLSERKVGDLSQRISEAEAFAEKMEGLALPSPELAPDDVVRIQTKALASELNREGIVQCMCFASPENLLATGPVEKFSRIVRGPQFEALAAPDAISVGGPTFQDSNARVMVTVLNGQRIHAYIWVLAKQTAPPYVDCWMTEGVFPLAEQPNSPNEI